MKKTEALRCEVDAAVEQQMDWLRTCTRGAASEFAVYEKAYRQGYLQALADVDAFKKQQDVEPDWPAVKGA